MDEVRNLIIIGSGPAGYTAAVYAARANLNPLVIEGVQSGGALMTTTEVENFPGFPDGILGPELMDNMRKQAERFGAEFITDDVTAVDFSERPFRIEVGNDEYFARAVIVATGASARQLGLESERTLQGRGVSYCAVCDAAFFRSKNVVVVDTRNPDEYNAGHMAGALFLPLEGRMTWPEEYEPVVKQLIATKRPVVTYCA